MGIISLEGIEFFAYHGYYDEEQKMGNKYSVDIMVATSFLKAAEHDQLSATVNYETLYGIIKQEIKQPSKLLESIAKRIIDKTFRKYPGLEWVQVSISKFNPPVGGVCTKAKVILKLDQDLKELPVW